MPRMITTGPLVYAGQSLASEMEFDAEPNDVKALTILNRARLVQTQEYRTRSMEAAPAGADVTLSPNGNRTLHVRRPRAAH